MELSRINYNTALPKDARKDLKIHQVLSAQKVGNMARRYREGLMLIYCGASDAEQVAVRFFSIDGRPMPEVDRGFHLNRGMQRLSILEQLKQHRTALERELMGDGDYRAVVEFANQSTPAGDVSASIAQAAKLSAAIEEKQKQIAETKSPAAEIQGLKAEIERLRAEKAAAQSVVEQAQGRFLEPQEHVPLFDRALRDAKRRLLIISPWINDRIMEPKLRYLEELLRRGVEVFIGFGITERGPDDRKARQGDQTLGWLQRKAEQYRNLHVVRLGDTHAKVLLMDDRFVVVGSFNWMSFGGFDRNENGVRVVREELSTVVTVPAMIEAKRGYWNGGPVPYGYAYDKNTQALLPHPTEAAILKRIFSEAAKLTSLTDLANALNAEGHRTKQRIMQRRDGTTENVGGRLFRSDGIRLLIRNPIYRGAVKFEGQEFSGKHEPLVDADLWERANAAVAETKERPGQSVAHPSFQARDIHNHLLKGIAWCAACNRALVPTDSGKKSVNGTKYRYYACSSVLRESQAPCAVGRLPADALEKSVVSILGETSKHPAIIKEIIDVSRNTQRRDAVELRSELAKKKQVIAVVEKQLSNCADAIAKGGVDVLGDALVRRATELREDRRRIFVEHEKLRQELAAVDAMVMEETRVRSNLDQFSRLLPTLTPAEQKELVSLFIERVDVRRIAQSSRKRSGVESSMENGDRTMELRLKLREADLSEGLKERISSGSSVPTPTPHVRGLGLDARVDFKNASKGEITLITPFSQTVRLSDRVRMPRVEKPELEHPIVRARKWQRMLDGGTVANRLALATQVGVDPAMVK